MSAKDGGPAFPSDNTTTSGVKGMTLRDYLAGQALVGLVALHSPVTTNMATGSVTVQGVAPEVVIFAYAYADAMLAERERET